jgi:preprotein translocase subunit SecE
MLNGLKKIPNFFIEIKEELKKVNWSTRQELKGALIVVVSVLIFLTVYFSIIDLGLSRLIHTLLQG